MKNLFRVLAFVVQCAVLGLAAAFVIGLAAPSFAERVRAWFGVPTPAPSIAAIPAPAGTAANPVVHTTSEHAAAERELPLNAPNAPTSYAGAVSRAAPAVVSITANKVFSTRQVLVPTNPALQKYFPGIAIGPPTTQRASYIGSGVIFSSEGYVLTNNHVIQGAEEIQVVLYDGRVRRAGVIGADADTDLAVLKIDADNLPSIAIATDPLNVGDVVLAIGNPFNLSRTVTMGIVSALGRQLGVSTYEDFIQTDAAINQGNSGGALVNAAGELVGINAADMQLPNGGNLGIGFAIPVHTAKAVLDQIVAHGRVIRGWLGAEFADVSNLQNPSTTRGVAVWKVYPDGPAQAGGLRPGDVVLAINGEPIAGLLELRTREAALAPGSEVELSGLRNGQPFSVRVVLQERPQRQTGA